VKRLLILLIPVAVLAGKQTLNVKVVQRQDNGTNYTYVVAGYSNTNANANCQGGNCNAQATSVSIPAMAHSYSVRGATLTLLLPDGRLAVVNCNAKVNWTEMNTNTYRSCRIPMFEAVEAEFDGDKAKLKWSVSIDGSKMESETYKVLAVIDKPKPE
jgi:hypothetical protein